MDYPTNWDVHTVPICSKCSTPVPYIYIEQEDRKYYIATQYETDGADGWHIGECPEGDA